VVLVEAGKGRRSLTYHVRSSRRLEDGGQTCGGEMWLGFRRDGELWGERGGN
jgi:hypothetical protein